jgi:hypothetical protein
VAYCGIVRLRHDKWDMDAKLERFPVDLNRAGFTENSLLQRASAAKSSSWIICIGGSRIGRVEAGRYRRLSRTTPRGRPGPPPPSPAVPPPDFYVPQRPGRLDVLEPPKRFLHWTDLRSCSRRATWFGAARRPKAPAGTSSRVFLHHGWAAPDHSRQMIQTSRGTNWRTQRLEASATRGARRAGGPVGMPGAVFSVVIASTSDQRLERAPIAFVGSRII